MTEIEKELFEKYGVSKVQRCSLDSDNCPFCFSHKCSECEVDDIMVYPPITAKKVLRLIEFVNRHCILCFEDFMFTKKITAHIIKDVGDNYPTITSQECDLTQTLCKLTTLLFDHLTPQERNEVKSILES